MQVLAGRRTAIGRATCRGAIARAGGAGWADSVVIFGLGYGVESLSAIRWMGDQETFYWGDIDTHGFAMLDRLRAMFPAARSLLMDRRTLIQHRAHWVEETGRHLAPLAHLTPEETELHDDLAADRLGPRVRLEQERLGYGWVMSTLDALTRS